MRKEFKDSANVKGQLKQWKDSCRIGNVILFRTTLFKMLSPTEFFCWLANNGEVH